MRFAFHSEQWLPYSPEVVFAFFANPDNLPRLMPAWQSARITHRAIVAPPLAISPGGGDRAAPAAGSGTRLTLGFRPFPYSPIRLQWKAEIVDFVENDHFCDIQLSGPFSYWKHCHRVSPESRPIDSGVVIAGTLLRDDLEYEVPFGGLGRLAQRLFIARQLRSTFRYRRERTRELLPQFAREEPEERSAQGETF